jgi:hypothetical protein
LEQHSAGDEWLFSVEFEPIVRCVYLILHDVSRATHRRGVLRADLSFLTSGTSA